MTEYEKRVREWSEVHSMGKVEDFDENGNQVSFELNSNHGIDITFEEMAALSDVFGTPQQVHFYQQENLVRNSK